jgi:hypothetical protein
MQYVLSLLISILLMNVVKATDSEDGERVPLVTATARPTSINMSDEPIDLPTRSVSYGLAEKAGRSLAWWQHKKFGTCCSGCIFGQDETDGDLIITQKQVAKTSFGIGSCAACCTGCCGILQLIFNWPIPTCLYYAKYCGFAGAGFCGLAACLTCIEIAGKATIPYGVPACKKMGCTDCAEGLEGGYNARRADLIPAAAAPSAPAQQTMLYQNQ